MKHLKISMLVLAVVALLSSCATVDPGHKGVEVSWGGETNMTTIYGEGMDGGFHWLFDDMVEYDCREKTIVQKFEFNDRNNMVTAVEISMDYSYNPSQVHLLHTKINDFDTKLLKTLKSAGKEVVPQYSASELNLTKRQEGEQKLESILSTELPEFYALFARVQITDVDIPHEIAQAAEQTAKQKELNKLAAEREEEARNNFNASEWDAKRKEILSEPEMLALKELENQEKMWDGYLKHGKSPFGSGNVFNFGTGSQSFGILKSQ